MQRATKRGLLNGAGYALAVIGVVLIAFLSGVQARGNDDQPVTFFADISTGWDDPLGHIWVRFGSDDRVYGFYPAGGDKRALLTLAGEVGDDAYRRADVSYTFYVSRSEFNRGLATVDEWRSKRYVFPFRNCKDMVEDVAKSIGLHVPSNYFKSPAEFLADLVDAN